MMTAIDLFAGCGGFTSGAKAAGLQVLWAANHWRAAVDVHQAAHPDVQHACEDLHRIDWTLVPAHDVLLASPCCQGHSRARGADRPTSDQSRSTAWAVIDCVEYHRPADIVVENVPEMMSWALYPHWRGALETLGYSLAESVLDAADCGVPQHRRRLFVHASRRRAARTLVPPPLMGHVSAESFLLDLPMGTPWRSLCDATRARCRNGRRTLGNRFLVSYYGNSTGGRTTAAPIGTITTRDRWALVDGSRLRMLHPQECRAAMGFPSDFPLPTNRRLAVHLLGNSVPPALAAAAITSALEP